MAWDNQRRKLTTNARDENCARLEHWVSLVVIAARHALMREQHVFTASPNKERLQQIQKFPVQTR